MSCKNVGAALVSVASDFTYDIWAYGIIFYEAIAGLPLSPYRSLHKAKRALTTAELFKVGQWDERSLRKALRHTDDNDSVRDLVKKLLHPNPNARAQSMRAVLEHPFFGIGKLAGEAPVFERHNLGSSVATNTVDINAYTDEHLKHRHELVVKNEAMAKVAQKKELPAVVEKRSEDESPAKTEGPASSLKPALETNSVSPPKAPAPPKPEIKKEPAPRAAVAARPSPPQPMPPPATPRAPVTPAMRVPQPLRTPPAAQARSSSPASSTATEKKQKSKSKFKMSKKGLLKLGKKK